MVKDTGVKLKVRSEYGLDCEGHKGLWKTVVANTDVLSLTSLGPHACTLHFPAEWNLLWPHGLQFTNTDNTGM